MAQSWHDLLFAHWPVSVAQLRSLVPGALPLDSFDGRAWIGVVPFRMTGVRLRATPPLPWISAFPELNIRTYVTAGGKPGVFFFSLDAGNPLVVAVARRWYHLPYYRARMKAAQEGEAIRYESRRTHRGAPEAELRARYGPTGPVDRAVPGTLPHWLTERYCLCVLDRGGGVWRGDIHHDTWPLQPAEAQIEANSMTAPLGLVLEGPPLLHFARRLDVRFWPLRKIGWGR
jgi:hypothetical protein